MSNQERKHIVPVHLIYGIVIVVIVASFLYMLSKSQQGGTLKLNVGNSQLELVVEDETLSIRQMLDELFKNDATRRESQALLREFGRFYSPNDPTLVQELERQEVDSEVSVRLRELLAHLRGPFDRSAHSFYDVEDVDVVDAIETLGYDHPVSKELRQLLTFGKGPFEAHEEPVLMSVPTGNLITKGRGASCKENRFYRKDTRIFNKARNRSISVFVSGSFPCPDADDAIKKLIQLSYEDMKQLVGDSPLDSVEQGYAQVVID